MGYLNLPWSAQIIKSIFNSASTLRITSNGISVEGSNKTVGAVSGQVLYPFDIYPIKWAKTEIPFTVTFKDDEDYTIKNYPPIYNHHSGTFNNTLYDINLKLSEETNFNKISFREYKNCELFNHTNLNNFYDYIIFIILNINSI